MQAVHCVQATQAGQYEGADEVARRGLVGEVEAAVLDGDVRQDDARHPLGGSDGAVGVAESPYEGPRLG